MKCVQNINTSFFQKLWVNLLSSWVIICSKSWMSDWRIFTYLTHLSWAISNLSNHNMFGIIPDPGSQYRIKLSLESISTLCQDTGVGIALVPTTEYHASSGFLAHFWGHGISPRRMVHQVHCLWVDFWLTILSMAIQVSQLKSNHSGSGRSHPAGAIIPSGHNPSFIDISWECW